MWPLLEKFLRRSTSRSHSFSFTTFKDVQTLCKEGEEQQQQKPQKNEDQDSKEASQTHLTRSAAIFHRVRIASSALRAWNSLLPRPHESNRIVVYFTSLRVVRKTFEDCRTVRSILQGFRVTIDERDLSMDAGFLEELKELLGKDQLTLPRVFIGGRYIGGADEIEFLHETGELKKIVQGFPMAKLGSCCGCGGVRFVLCLECSGSRKVFLEEGGFRTCSDCNENGLIRCPSCCR